MVIYRIDGLLFFSTTLPPHKHRLRPVRGSRLLVAGSAASPAGGFLANREYMLFAASVIKRTALIDPPYSRACRSAHASSSMIAMHASPTCSHLSWHEATQLHLYMYSVHVRIM